MGSGGAAGRDDESDDWGRFLDGLFWIPCPHLIGGLPCESCVAVPTRGVNDSTIIGSPRGSSATWAEVNANVSPPPVRVRSTLGPPAKLFVTGSITSYAEGDLDARLGSVSAPSVSSTSVEARSTGGWVPIAACEPDAMSVACTSPEGRSTGSMLEVAGSASTEGRRPTRMLEVTVSSPEDLAPLRVVHR
jgi:hypothetical protein